MARVQYGVIVTELKGKIQGQVFQGGNVGYVLRNKGYVPGVPTTARKFANSRLAANAAAWRSLTDADRTEWANLAPDWIFYNKFGASYQGTGYQIFNSYNTYLANLALSTVSTPGAVSSPTDPGLMEMFTDGVGSLLFERENNGLITEKIAVFGAAPMSAGRNTNNVRFIKIANFAGNTGVSIDFFSNYIQFFPVYAAGQRITIRVVFHLGSFPYPFFATNLTCIAQDPSA